MIEYFNFNNQSQLVRIRALAVNPEKVFIAYSSRQGQWREKGTNTFCC
jgi:hypothetical protein